MTINGIYINNDSYAKISDLLLLLYKLKSLGRAVDMDLLISDLENISKKLKEKFS